jgi:hypothetical protein
MTKEHVFHEIMRTAAANGRRLLGARACAEIPAPDLEQDTPKLAARIRQGKRGRYHLHKRGDVR